MNKPEIFFRPIGNSGPLSIYWYPGPYGNAIECKEGKGVVWLSPTGDILGVEFDDVNKDNDHQILKTPDGTNLEVFVSSSKVRIKTNLKEAINKT